MNIFHMKCTQYKCNIIIIISLGLPGTTIIHVNALHRDISGGRDNFDCNAHDQYSLMEANRAEIGNAKCEHAQYARRNPFN